MTMQTTSTRCRASTKDSTVTHATVQPRNTTYCLPLEEASFPNASHIAASHTAPPLPILRPDRAELWRIHIDPSANPRATGGKVEGGEDW